MDGRPLGLLLLVVAAVMNASFTLPMKFTRDWAWENTWLVWTVFALWVLPPAVTLATVPHLAGVYREAGAGALLAACGFGAGWGVAQVLFGLAVESIGIALTFSIVLGLSAAVGSVIPMLRLHPEKMATAGGAVLLAGVALILAGVAVCAIAGRKREAAMAGADRPAGAQRYSRGLTLAILCGLGASLVNFGLVFGQPLIDAAAAAGAGPLWAPNAVWMPVMLAGSLPNLAYCIHLLRKNRTGGRFTAPGTRGYFGLAAVMAIFWFASNIVYGVSAGKLGDLGAILGWPLFMSLIVITASTLGIATGEWKAAGRAPLRVQLLGVAILVAAVFVLSTASRMM